MFLDIVVFFIQVGDDFVGFFVFFFVDVEVWGFRKLVDEDEVNFSKEVLQGEDILEGMMVVNVWKVV